MKNNKFYITTPIYYVNGDPHIGHAYTTIAADIIARFNRMLGKDTFLLTGSDEHGEKIMQAAAIDNMDPQAFVDKNSAKFEITWDNLNISNDNFIRTTSKNHKLAVQKSLQKLFDKGLIYKGEHNGLYCIGCEQYKTEKDLVDGLCSDHQKKPIEVKEDCYMFKLSVFRNIIKNKIETDELQIKPEDKKNEVLSFLNEGLKDISFSRKIKWGVELPWDTTQTAYVWPDAFLNYITGLDWNGEDKAPPMWPAEVQLMSKDIIRVHATIWIAILLGLELPLPKKLFVHGFFLVNGQKMSKSVGNVITPDDLLKNYGTDGTRYLLASATPFGHDGDISMDKFDLKYNADLANGIGNLVARSISLTKKMKDAGIKLSTNSFATNNSNQDTWGDQIFQHEIHSAWEDYKKNLDDLQLDLSIRVVQEQISFLDNYITTVKPWELIRDNNPKTGEVIYNILERIRHIALMMLPFIPETADKILSAISLDPEQEKQKGWETFTKWGGLLTDAEIKESAILFPRK
ncbi:methionine--tRNA ligase [Patescibacteria group bacterium]|nr:methionine--tRNA ligase [Patescibacteria group bacterium]